MIEIGSPQFWIAALQIVLINILLSGDNAVVIALACRNLSKQLRRRGIFWGVLGAIALRVVLTFSAVSLLANPYLKLIGGVLLIWIGIKLIAEGEGGEHHVKANDRLLAAVRTIIVADLVMSLDNVMGVAAAAKGNVTLIVFGLAVSIPIVVLGSQLIMRLIERFPVVVLAGGGLLGYIAGEMAIQDPAIAPWIAANATHVATWLPAACFALVVAIGWSLARRQRANKTA
jgi:YjbE family integral membrane protein